MRMRSHTLKSTHKRYMPKVRKSPSRRLERVRPCMAMPENPSATRSDWGPIKLIAIETGSDFWTLLDEVADDSNEYKGFYHNKRTIVEAYKRGDMYGLQVAETPSMLRRGASQDHIFCSNSFCLLPCFCIRNGETAVIIWTHPRARRMGFARKLVQELEIKKAECPLKDSFEFWKSCGICIEKSESRK